MEISHVLFGMWVTQMHILFYAKKKLIHDAAYGLSVYPQNLCVGKLILSHILVVRGGDWVNRLIHSWINGLVGCSKSVFVIKVSSLWHVPSLSPFDALCHIVAQQGDPTC
jgi:hypothetical protein